MTDKLKLDVPIAVEGKYDKIKVAAVADAQIIVTDGFGVFASDEKMMLIRRLAEPHGIIVLTDSDGAGRVIRNYFNSILPKDKLFHLYIPEIEGKEKRKKTPSKAGTLGVEGMEAGLIRALLEPFAVGEKRTKPSHELTKTDFYADGFSGTEGSVDKRAKLCKYLNLPTGMSANALLAAINLLGETDKYEEFLKNDGQN